MKRIINSRFIIFLFGFLFGVFALSIMAFTNKTLKEKVYFKVKHDYCIENIGQIKAGTILQIDEGMSEGFTRYILYLNIIDSQELDKFQTEEKNTIIPYWLTLKDTTCHL